MSKKLRRVLAGVSALAVVGATTAYGVHWFATDRYLESTDDAYFKADFTIVAPKVSGYVSDVLADDNQPVKAGQVLARIDDRDLRTALDQAKADVDTANATIANIDAQQAMQQALVAQARADIDSVAAGVNFAKADDARYQDLVREHVTTIQRAEQAHAALRQQSAQLERSQAGLLAAQKQLEVLASDRAKAETQLEHAKAVAAQAELNLSYATIAAPIDGTVGARSIRVGQYVQAGTQLMAVVPLQSVYVLANFKETQLAHMRNGEPAEITVDGLDGVAIHGRIDSLSPASGLEFALLPPDNATGNFTKIVQRVPVKITLDHDSPLIGRLRPGMSVEATVDTKAVVLAGDAPSEQVAQR
ncbi:MAG TPA: HlyD family secretion protein [Stellaceae bacterium]|nr:HlyD family secretion protein [Stellaceae bacterium]